MSFYPRRETTDDLPLFARRPSPCASDLEEGLRRKDEGQNRVETRAPELAEILRAEARRISAERGWVMIDDVRAFADRLGFKAPHPNFWGCIFRGVGWERVGEEPSERPENHGHRNPRWRWTGEDDDGEGES